MLNRRGFLQAITASLAALGWVRPAQAKTVEYAENITPARPSDYHISARVIHACDDPRPRQYLAVSCLAWPKSAYAWSHVHETDNRGLRVARAQNLVHSVLAHIESEGWPMVGLEDALRARLPEISYRG